VVSSPALPRSKLHTYHGHRPNSLPALSHVAGINVERLLVLVYKG
jgi:hypothetical protein